MDIQTVKGIIKKELPVLINVDMEIRNLILDISKNIVDTKADKYKTEDKFNKILEELRRDREVQIKKWKEQDKKWYEHNELLNKKWEEQDKKWYEQNRLLSKKWDEQDKRWEELRKTDEDLRQSISVSIGSLGARWGRDSEASFRYALKGILEQHFNIEVFNYIEYDDEGEVFGHPDQIELDIIIRDGSLIICELKSSMSNSDVYTFYKKAEFYEKRHHKKADSLIVISPMLDEKAKKVALKFGIKIYSSAYDVDKL